MKRGFERACELLDGYSRLIGSTGDDRLAFDGEKSVEIFDGLDTVVNVTYLEQSDSLLCWALAGDLPETADEAEACRYLLERGANAGDGMGYVFSLRPDSSMLVVQDLRPLVSFEDAENLGAWIEACLVNVEAVREKFDMTAPVENEVEEEE